MRIWEERIKRFAHQQLHLSVLTIVNIIYKYFERNISMLFFLNKNQERYMKWPKYTLYFLEQECKILIYALFLK